MTTHTPPGPHEDEIWRFICSRHVFTQAEVQLFCAASAWKRTNYLRHLERLNLVVLYQRKGNIRYYTALDPASLSGDAAEVDRGPQNAQWRCEALNAKMNAGMNAQDRVPPVQPWQPETTEEKRLWAFMRGQTRFTRDHLLAQKLTVASGLTPSRLSSILLAANEGNLYDYLVLAEEMEERDPHYASVLGIRKRAISGIEPIVTPASDSALDKRIADDVRENLAEHEGFSDLVEDMLDALGKGFSQVEIIWERNKNTWAVEEFLHHDPRFFTFDRDTGREVRMVDEADMVNGIELSPFKWISHKAKLKSGLAIRGGLARLVSFGWMCKSYTVKDWIAFIETYGLPLRLGRYGPNATAADVDVLFNAVANIGTDAAAVIPENMKIEFVQAMTGAANSKVFESLARWVDEQTSKAVLGQTMTSDNGSSSQPSMVNAAVQTSAIRADSRP